MPYCIHLRVLLFKEDKALGWKGNRDGHHCLHEEVHAHEKEVASYCGPLDRLGVVASTSVEVQSACIDRHEDDLEDPALHDNRVSDYVDQITL